MKKHLPIAASLVLFVLLSVLVILNASEIKDALYSAADWVHDAWFDIVLPLRWAILLQCIITVGREWVQQMVDRGETDGIFGSVVWTLSMAIALRATLAVILILYLFWPVPVSDAEFSYAFLGLWFVRFNLAFLADLVKHVKQS
jgi:hypothetical protein